jgi:hypothetical protein
MTVSSIEELRSKPLDTRHRDCCCLSVIARCSRCGTLAPLQLSMPLLQVFLTRVHCSSEHVLLVLSLLTKLTESVWDKTGDRFRLRPTVVSYTAVTAKNSCKVTRTAYRTIGNFCHRFMVRVTVGSIQNMVVCRYGTARNPTSLMMAPESYRPKPNPGCACACLPPS